jgi:hypothetical protein
MNRKAQFDQSSVRDFEFAHGRKPRGNGEWCFTLHRNGSSTREFVSGTFTDAKQQAMRLARDLGCDVVTLDS